MKQHELLGILNQLVEQLESVKIHDKDLFMLLNTAATLEDKINEDS